MSLLIEARNAAVGVRDGHIASTQGHFDTTLRILDGELRPGLINAHDHLHRNHYGRLGGPVYSNAYEWGRDIHDRYALEISRGRRYPRRRALLRGAWKNLLAGVTTVVHHDPWEADFEADFPIRVARVRWAHAPRLEESLASHRADNGPLAIHLAEGTDSAAADEIRELDRLGLLDADLIAVHVVGADEDGIARLRRAGAAIAWCPTSNYFLFGRTVVRELLAPGTDVLLGSDSLLSGAGSLLDELRFARRLGLLDDVRLLDAVGATAARRLCLSQPSLEMGAPADLTVFRSSPLEATEADVALVMVGGALRVLDPRLSPSLPFSLRGSGVVRAGGVARLIFSGRSSRASAARSTVGRSG